MFGFPNSTWTDRHALESWMTVWKHKVRQKHRQIPTPILHTPEESLCFISTKKQFLVLINSEKVAIRFLKIRGAWTWALGVEARLSQDYRNGTWLCSVFLGGGVACCSCSKWKRQTQRNRDIVYCVLFWGRIYYIRDVCVCDAE